MGHVFISYSHKDTEYAHGLADHLKNTGFDVWIDERLDYGSQWPNEIQKQLDSCDAFILVMTPRSFASEWVQSELQRAKRKLKAIFPLLLEGDEPWLSVESTQYYDVRGEHFPDARFYSALKRVMSTGPAVSTLQFSKRSVKAKSAGDSSIPKFRTGIVVAIIGAVAVVSAICVTIILVRPLLSKRLSPTPISVFPSSVVTATEGVILETSTFAPNPSVTPDFPVPLAATSTLRPTQTLTPLPPSGTCQDGYVYRLIRSSDKVCVSPASKAQADADNSEADSRKILSVLLNAYGENTCASGYVWRGAYQGDLVCVTPDVRDQVLADNTAASSRWTDGAYGPYTCVSGFVWRGAIESDLVCVTSDVRDQTAADNNQAESRKAINVYSENECISGYVWREAFQGDFVCVTPEVRQQVANDNRNAPSHTWP